jgi:hypothetical protein
VGEEPEVAVDTGHADEDVIPMEPTPNAPLALTLTETAEEAYSPPEEEATSMSAEAMRAMVEEVVTATLAPLYSDIVVVKKTVAHLQERVLGAESEDETTREIAHGIREEFANEMAAADNALVDLSTRLDRVEEHVGLKPSLLSCVERVLGDLDEAAQEGRVTPKAVARMHRKLRAAAEDEASSVWWHHLLVRQRRMLERELRRGLESDQLVLVIWSGPPYKVDAEDLARMVNEVREARGLPPAKIIRRKEPSPDL